MLEACRLYAAGEFRETLDCRFEKILGAGSAWSLQVDALDGNVVRFRYPLAISEQVAYIRPEVVLELGTHAEFVPRGEFEIRSYAAQEFPGLFTDPAVRLSCLLAKRTFWEKVTILHAEHHRPAAKPFPGRYSRHYYDVAMIAPTAIGQDALEDLALLNQVVRHKHAFYPAAWARYDLAEPGSLKLLPPESRLAALKEHYRSMAVMFFGNPPSFEMLLDTLGRCERQINAAGALCAT